MSKKKGKHKSLDKAMKPHIRWLEAMPCITKVVLGISEACRHRSPLPAVVPIRVALPPTPATPIELALPSGTVLRFPAECRPELIVAILGGLEERPC